MLWCRTGGRISPWLCFLILQQTKWHWTGMYHLTQPESSLRSTCFKYDNSNWIFKNYCLSVATSVDRNCFHRSLSGISPTYLADDCHLVADARERRLRSTESRTCVVARTYSSFGGRAFAAAGPVLWNSLPSHLKEADLLYSQFRHSLKTFLFG